MVAALGTDSAVYATNRMVAQIAQANFLISISLQVGRMPRHISP
jgi:hypothetical protein